MLSIRKTIGAGHLNFEWILRDKVDVGSASWEAPVESPDVEQEVGTSISISTRILSGPHLPPSAPYQASVAHDAPLVTPTPQREFYRAPKKVEHAHQANLQNGFLFYSQPGWLFQITCPTRRDYMLSEAVQAVTANF